MGKQSAFIVKLQKTELLKKYQYGIMSLNLSEYNGIYVR